MTNIPAFGVDEIAAKDYDWQEKGVFKKFRQWDLVDAGWFDKTGLAYYGYMFFPNQCIEEGASCHIHFHLHGCTGQGKYIVIKPQFGEYAVTNDLIMVYP